MKKICAQVKLGLLLHLKMIQNKCKYKCQPLNIMDIKDLGPTVQKLHFIFTKITKEGIYRFPFKLLSVVQQYRVA